MIDEPVKRFRHGCFEAIKSILSGKCTNLWHVHDSYQFRNAAPGMAFFVYVFILCTYLLVANHVRRTVSNQIGLIIYHVCIVRTVGQSRFLLSLWHAKSYVLLPLLCFAFINGDTLHRIAKWNGSVLISYSICELEAHIY